MPLRPLTKQDVVAVSNYIREHATIMTNKAGKQFIGLDGFNHEIAGLTGQLRFGYFGLSEVGENKQRQTQRVNDAIDAMTPQERKALLERLAAPAAPAAK